ncbi:MAG: PP2C family protein-serine/threonine phosphatase [Myxococcota bacterium]|nr:PP2C family protein-serine/threonine phosphatase [Myxococcota bacterium]
MIRPKSTTRGQEHLSRVESLLGEDDALTRDLLTRCIASLNDKRDEDDLSDDHPQEHLREQVFPTFSTDWSIPVTGDHKVCLGPREKDPIRDTHDVLYTMGHINPVTPQIISANASDTIAASFDPDALRLRLESILRLATFEQDHHTESTALRDRELAQVACALATMLPRARSGPDVNLGWIFKPSAFVGGDLFNVTQIDNHRLGLFGFDVVGHGVNAALFAVGLGSILRPRPGSDASLKDVLAPNYLGEPKLLAEYLNEVFPLKPPMDMYFTLFYAVIDQHQRKMKWIRAGHPPPVFYGDDQCTLLQDGDPPIGFFQGYKFTEYERDFERGDRLFVYSDGLTEARNASSQMFGVDRLMSIIAAKNNNPINSVVHEIEEEVLNYSGSSRFEDDLSLLALEFVK